ncbi:outer-membrane lipoprotein carrier protein LolA [bacterium]|nr:outer-membrane lipoprotein carrier protein LolA [bacterium]
MKFSKILVLAALLFSFTLFADDATQIATKILGRYNDIKSFSTNFSRVFIQSSTGKKTTDGGTISFIAPSNIRMDVFTDGKLTEQTFVDAKQTVLIYHSKKSALVRKSSSEASDYLVFLKGLPEVEKRFTVTDSTGTIEKAKKTGMTIKPGSEMLKLTPKNPIPNVKYIFITAINGEIDSVIIIDQLKNINQFTFSGIKLNPALDKKSFDSSIPKGFEVSDF